jgi:hypothetical protein
VVKEESGLARILKEKQARSVVSSFEDSRSPLIGRKYDDLRKFFGGIGSVMPGTATVDSDCRSSTGQTTQAHRVQLTFLGGHSSLQAVREVKEIV